MTSSLSRAQQESTLPRHFLDLSDFSGGFLRSLLEEAKRRKAARLGAPRARPDGDAPLDGRVLAVIFEKPSTRTRVSFDVALRQLGAGSLILSASDLQLGRGETIADTARVLSRYVDGIVLRTWGHDRLLELSAHATVPVLNALTDYSHPCQVLADIMTFEEHVGPIDQAIVTWCGDICNVTHSWIHACAAFGFELRLSHPGAFPLDRAVMAWALDRGARLVFEPDPKRAVLGAHCVTTDTWFSMNEDRTEEKVDALVPYRVTTELMDEALDEAIFLHCLPCHRGEEVVEAVVDGPRSRVFDQAENRVHIQKAILAWCFLGDEMAGSFGGR